MMRFLRRDKWWMLLIVALAVFSLWAVVAVYQKVSDGEQQDNIKNTEADLYWFEQVVVGQVDLSQRRVMDMMTQVQRTGGVATQFVQNSTSLMQTTMPYVTNIIWLNANGSLQASASNNWKNANSNYEERNLLEAQNLELAYQNNVTVAAGPFKGDDGQYEMSLIQPIHDDAGLLTGFVKTRYSLQALFKHAVPAWYSKKYQLNVQHGSDTVFRTADNVVGFGQQQYTATREIKISGLSLNIQSQLYPDNQIWVLRALFAGMVFLLVTLLASLLALLFDMRRRRAIEKKLATQNNLRHAIEASLTVGIRAHSMDGTMIYVNPAFCDMTGYSEEEMLNIPPPLPYIPKEEAAKLFAVRDQLLIEPLRESMIEIKMRKKSGEVIDTIMRGGPMYDENNKHVGWITSVEDVTERKRLELFQESEQKRLESINHLVSMGEMASAIAHELNQPLSAISGYATGLSNYIVKGERSLSREKLNDVIEKIRRQAERAANVTRRVQLFAKQKTIAPTDVDVSTLITQVIDFMELEVRQKGCHIENHTQNLHLPSVLIDNTMAQQILINILRNAIDVMLEYNVIDKRIDIRAEQYSSHHILIIIQDQGPGVPEDKVETIFKAFYTTKTQGIGIGLNICRTMIESNGGRLWAKAGTHGGLFYLTIPINQAEFETKRE